MRKSPFSPEELMEIMTYLAGKKCPVCGSQELTAIDLVILGAPTYGALFPAKLLVECSECGYNMLFKNMKK